MKFVSLNCRFSHSYHFLYPYPTRTRHLHTRTQVRVRVPDPRVAVLYSRTRIYTVYMATRCLGTHLFWLFNAFATTSNKTNQTKTRHDVYSLNQNTIQFCFSFTELDMRKFVQTINRTLFLLCNKVLTHIRVTVDIILYAAK